MGATDRRRSTGGGGDADTQQRNRDLLGQKVAAAATCGRDSRARGGLECDHLVSLRALGALGFDEFDTLAVVQRAVTFTDNRAEVHEQVLAILALDEAVAFAVVEPLDGTSLLFRH